MAKGEYIKCPRCELNYIHKSKDFCDVCLAEIKLGLQAGMDEDEYEEVLELCPICKVNYIKFDEDMCSTCKEDLEFKKDEVDIDKDEEWRSYLDDDKEIALSESDDPLLLSELDEEDEFFDDEEEDFIKIKDDFDIVLDSEVDFDDETDDEDTDDDEDF